MPEFPRAIYLGVRNLNRKIISLVLALCMVISSVAVGSFVANAVTDDSEEVLSGDQAAQETVQGSAVLHCFDWSYNNIKANMKAIANAGYTAVQTSPVQPPKDFNSGWTDQGGQWWKLYQPIGISIADGNTWLGTKAQLKSMCEEADKYGIKVIVDIVANHMADNGMGCNGLNNVSSQVESAIRSNSNYWHLDNIYADNDNNRYHVTHGAISLPDLNTGNSYIQNRFKQLCIDCINLGVDGFRFDAAKHIELPTDNPGSNFWPTVIDGSKTAGSNIYYYGEILNYAGTDISNYTKYMSITDNYSGDKTLNAVKNSNAGELASSSYSKGAGASKSVIWAESHDTYMGSSGSGGISNTSSISDANIIKAWAIVGSRADSTALFFARPASTMGAASSNTTWKSTAVAEVNKFKNYFDGESEYLSSENGVAYNERGTTGVVISRLSGGGSVSLTAHKMKDGSYKDQVSGNTFTVKNGKITGTVGSTGVAVVYNATAPGPSASVTPGTSSYKTDTLTLTLSYSNASSGQYSVDGGSYQTYATGKTITIGSGVAYGGVTTVKVKATDGATTSDEVTYTYTKVDPNQTQKVYFDNSSYGWSSVYAYIYSGEGSLNNGSWPGQKMTLDSATGYYVLEVPKNLAEGKVIFTESSSAVNNRYPASDEPGLDLEGVTKLFRANNQLIDYTPAASATTVKPTETVPQPTTVPVTGKVLLGDVSGDGIISIRDATEIQRHAAQIIELVGNEFISADVSRDGHVTVLDATAVQRYSGEFTEGIESCGMYVGEDVVQPTVQPTTSPIQETTEAQPTAPAGQITLRFTNSAGWSGKIYCYYWGNSGGSPGFPGTEMTSLGGLEYTINIPKDAAYVIFSNGSSSAQTVDIPISGSAHYQTGSLSGNGHYNYVKVS